MLDRTRPRSHRGQSTEDAPWNGRRAGRARGIALASSTMFVLGRHTMGGTRGLSGSIQAKDDAPEPPLARIGQVLAFRAALQLAISVVAEQEYPRARRVDDHRLRR